MRKRKHQYVKPLEKVVEVPMCQRSYKKLLWYDKNYYCKKCGSFYDKSLMIPSVNNKIYHCGVCQDRTKRIRLNPKRSIGKGIRS